MPLHLRRPPKPGAEWLYLRYVASCRRRGIKPVPEQRARNMIARLLDVLAGRRKNHLSAGGVFVFLFMALGVLALFALAFTFGA